MKTKKQPIGSFRKVSKNVDAPGFQLESGAVRPSTSGVGASGWTRASIVEGDHVQSPFTGDGSATADPRLTWRHAGVEGLLLLVGAGRRVAHGGRLGAAGVGRVVGVGLLGATGVLGLLLRALFVADRAVGLLVLGDRSARAGVVVDLQREVDAQRVGGGVQRIGESGPQRGTRRGRSQAQGGQGRQGNAGTVHGMISLVRAP